MLEIYPGAEGIYLDIIHNGYGIYCQCDKCRANGLVDIPHLFPEHGRLAGIGPDARYRTVSIEEYRKWANEEVLVIVMIEDREAVENVDAIAAVPGIDVLYIGPADLSQSYGHFLDFDHKLMRKAIDKVASASAENKK